MNRISKLRLTVTPLAIGLLLSSQSVWALYKVVGPDGKVSYTDRPPVTGSSKGGEKVTSISATGAQSAADSSNVPLPLALREVVRKFPVVLYSAASDCEPCNAGRQLLQQRGIPFTERTASTNEDLEALQRMTGTRDVPSLTIGAQVLRGFAGGEWNQYLDTAGYPATSALPRGYKAAAATPLTTPRAADAASASEPAAAPAQRTAAPARPEVPPPPPPPPPPPAPGGIRF